mgnify:CR=1 FL=1
MVGTFMSYKEIGYALLTHAKLHYIIILNLRYINLRYFFIILVYFALEKLVLRQTFGGI